MRRLLVVLLAFVLLAGCSISAFSLAGADILKSDERIAVELAVQRRQAERAALEAERQRPFWTTVQYSSVLLILGITVVVIDEWRKDQAVKRQRIAPDANGLYAIDTSIIRAEVQEQIALALATGAMQAAIARAQSAQVLPYHYAPKIDVVSPSQTQPSAPSQPMLTSELPILSDNVALVDTLQHIKPGHLAFGVTLGNELLQLPFAACYHALWTGDTRTGKTNGLDGVIVQLHHLSRRLPIDLYGGDFKQELAATWSRSTLFAQGIQTEPRAIADMLGELVNGPDGVRARYDLFKRTGNERKRVIRNVIEYAKVAGQPPRLSVLILDEINALIEAAKKSEPIAENLKQLLQLGAGAGVYVLGGAQYLTAAVFGRDGSKQFTSRALFGAYDPYSVQMLFGKVESDTLRPLITGKQGRGLIRTVKQATPLPFQALRCDEDDILGAIAVVAPLRSTGSTVGATEHYNDCYETRYGAWEQPKTALPQVLEEVPVTPAPPIPTTPRVAVSVEERMAILAAVEELTVNGKKPSRRKVCHQVFGVQGGSAFDKVKAVLDQAGI